MNHVKSESYKINLLGELIIYMVLKLDLVGGIPRERVWSRMHMKESVKHDMHIKSKSYKFKLLGKLIVYTVISELDLVGGIELELSSCKFEYLINLY